jgi:hypothetical protein
MFSQERRTEVHSRHMWSLPKNFATNDMPCGLPARTKNSESTLQIRSWRYCISQLEREKTHLLEQHYSFMRQKSNRENQLIIWGGNIQPKHDDNRLGMSRVLTKYMWNSPPYSHIHVLSMVYYSSQGTDRLEVSCSSCRGYPGTFHKSNRSNQHKALPPYTWTGLLTLYTLKLW